MHCGFCGIKLPPGLATCPNCGTPTPHNISRTGPDSANDRTILSSYSGAGNVREPGTPAQPPPSSNQQQVSFPNSVFQQPPLSAPQPAWYPDPQQQTPFAAPQPPPPYSGTQQPTMPAQPSPPYFYSDPQQQQAPLGTPHPPPYSSPQQPYAPQTPSYPAPASQPPLYLGASSPTPGTFPAPTLPQLPPQPFPQQVPTAQPRRGLSQGMTILLIVLAGLLLLGGGGLIYYTAIYQPAQQHAQATATVQTQLTTQAQATLQANMQATGTAQAFANATVTAVAVATAQVQATATALQNLYTQATSGTPTLNDSLTSQGSGNWAVYNLPSGETCQFTGGALHAGASKTFGAFCFAANSNFSDFAYQVDLTILQGDTAGIIFRANSSATVFYFLSINPNGNYRLAVIGGAAGSSGTNLAVGTSPAIKTGLNQPNELTILARGSTFYIYINQQYVATATDTTASSGKIGVIAANTANQASDVAFTNAKVWPL